MPATLEMMLAMLGYDNVCVMWVLWMLIEEKKYYWIQICQNLLNHDEAESDDKKQCYHYKLK